MIYALLGTALGGFGAVLSFLFGAPIYLALTVYIGTGVLCLGLGLALAALCVWRHPAAAQV